MVRRAPRALVAATSWLAVSAAGCTSDDDVRPPEGGLDATVVVDAAHDAPSFADGNVPHDAGPDVAIDATVDAPTTEDAPADVAPDAIADAGADVFDAGVDTGTDAGACISPAALGGAVTYGRAPHAGSPDGTTWVVTAGADRLLYSGGHPHVSRAGALVALRRGGWPVVAQDSIVMRTVATGAEVPIYTPPGSDNYTLSLAFSVDDTKCYFDWHSMNVERTDGTGGISDAFNYDGYDDAPAVSPTNGAFVVHNTNVGLITMDSAGGTRTTVANTVHGDFWPMWSPDGATLAFLRYGGDFIGQPVARVMKIAPNGAGLTPLASAAPVDGVDASDGGDAGDGGAPGFDGLPQWSTDGAWVVVPGGLAGATRLLAVASDGSGVVLPVCGVTSGDAVDWVGGVGAAATDAGAPATPSGWKLVRIEDCSGADVTTTNGTDVPDDTKCTSANAGKTAVCWDGVTHSNAGAPGTAFCTYKTTTASACTGGVNNGWLYICEP